MRQVFITEHGEHFKAHEVDGTTYNAMQHTAFAFLVGASVCDKVVQVSGRLLNKVYDLAHIVCDNDTDAHEVAQSINDLAHGEICEEPIARITAAHCVALACKENRYKSKWSFEKVDTDTIKYKIDTLTLESLISRFDG